MLVVLAGMCMCLLCHSQLFCFGSICCRLVVQVIRFHVALVVVSWVLNVGLVVGVGVGVVPVIGCLCVVVFVGHVVRWVLPDKVLWSVCVRCQSKVVVVCVFEWVECVECIVEYDW